MIIIDNSLCNIDFTAQANENSVAVYIYALFKSGVSLIEIDRNAIKYLEQIDLSEKFIFRIESCADFFADFIIFNERKFSYIVLPENMIETAKILSGTNVIIEIDAQNRSPHELIQKIKALDPYENGFTVRIKKDFSCAEDAEEFIALFEGENVPFLLDICPLNISSAGCEAAEAAYFSSASAVTLSFGSEKLYTPFELFAAHFDIQRAQLYSLYLASYYYGVIAKGKNQSAFNIECAFNSEGIALSANDMNIRKEIYSPDFSDGYTNDDIIVEKIIDSINRIKIKKSEENKIKEIFDELNFSFCGKNKKSSGGFES